MTVMACTRKVIVCIFFTTFVLSIFHYAILYDVISLELLSLVPQYNIYPIIESGGSANSVKPNIRQINDVLSTLQDSREVTKAESNSGSASHEKTSASASGRKIISGTCAGRLGNQMFKHASLLGLALQFNRSLVHEHPGLGNGFAHLTSLSVSVLNQFKNNTKGLNTETNICSHHVKQFLSANPSIDHVVVGGYMHAWCYFDKFRDRIRREFLFHDDLIAFRNDFYAKETERAFGARINTDDVTFIGVHIRRKDMLNGLAKGRVVADKTYLQHAVDYMESHTMSKKNKLYVVASDDKIWSRENMEAPSPVVFVAGALAGYAQSIIDMAVLAGCNHSIITVGTYGWWAAYLAGGITVYYKRFPLENSVIGNKTIKADYYLPEWIGLD